MLLTFFLTYKCLRDTACLDFSVHGPHFAVSPLRRLATLRVEARGMVAGIQQLVLTHPIVL